MIRKFFNADAEEIPAAAETQPEAEFDVMSAFAKSARLVNPGETAPEYIPETPVEAQEQNHGTVDAAVTEEAQAQDEAQSGTPQAEEAEETQVAQAAAEPVKWQDAVKDLSPKEVLSELGYDEKIVNFLEHWRNGGDVKQYLSDLTTDYENMPSDELMKHQLRREYPKADERAINLLYRKEVLEKFKIGDDFTEEENEEGRILLDLYSEKYRQEILNEQKQRLIPAAPPVPEKVEKVEETPQEPNYVQQELESSLNAVKGSEFYKKVAASNKLTFGEGDEAFNFGVNPEELTQILYDPVKFVESLFKIEEKGGQTKLIADPQHQLLTAAVAKHGWGLISELAKHFKAIGAAKAIKPIENPSTATSQGMTSPNEYANMSPAAMLAKSGRVN